MLFKEASMHNRPHCVTDASLEVEILWEYNCVDLRVLHRVCKDLRYTCKVRCKHDAGAHIA